jgi:hypothetical protein
MSELFAAFRQHLIWGLMLWVLIFTAFTALFASGRLIAFAVGLGRVLASIVATPFRFIRRAVAAVMGHTADAETRYRASDQYLLNKGMLVLQAVMIVLAVGLLSAAVVVTWSVLVPPSEVRRAAREYARDVEAQRQKSSAAAATMTKLDAEWAQKEPTVVAAYRQTRQSRIAGVRKDMASLKASIQSYAGPNGVSTLQRLEEAVAGRSNDSPDDIGAMKRYLDAIVSNNWYWLGDWGTTLRRWNHLWQEKVFAEYELATLSIDDLRNAEQSTYLQAKSAREYERETLSQMERALLNHREAARLKWKAAFYRTLGSFVTFLMFVWLAGALIEGGWMAVHVADDIRRMRQSSTPDTPMATEAQELQVPIRNADSPRSIPAEA